MDSIIEQKVRPNGLKINKVRVPIGVIGIIYESRPNVTIDCAGRPRVGLGLDFTQPGNSRVILGNDPWTEDRALVTLESAADQLVEFGNVGKAPTGAMHGNEPLALPS